MRREKIIRWILLPENKMDKFEEVKKLIKNNSEIVSFAEYGDGISDKVVLSAEMRLGVKFPLSYVWWLKELFWRRNLWR